MRIVSLLGMICVLLLGSAAAGVPDDCTAAGCAPESRIVRVGYTQFPPFSSTNGLGTAQGYAIDMLRQFLEPQGYALSFVEHNNPAELLESLREGQIDATTILAINATRAQVGRFTQPFESFSTGIFVRRGHSPVEEVADLDGMRIGVSRGSLGARLVEELPNTAPVYYDTTEGLVLPLLEREVDAVAAPMRGMQNQLNETALNNLIEATPLRINPVEGGILVHPGRPELLRDLDAGIVIARNDGNIAALQEKWFAPPPRTFTPEELQLLYATGAVLAVFLAFWIKAFIKVRRQAKSIDARSRQLQSALDATGATFLLADGQMRIQWCNDPFLKEFPTMRELFGKNKGLDDYLIATFSKDAEGTNLSPEVVREKALDRIARLKQGEEINRIKTTEDGRVLKQRIFMLPDGNFGAISTDVSELAEERDLIRQDADRLEITNKRLERFSQIVAHDLVAPIRNQRMLLDFIREDLAQNDMTLPAEVHDCFEQSEVLLKRQAQLVTDLLDWSKSLHAGPSEAFWPADRVANAVSLATVPPGFQLSLPDNMPRLKASPVAWELVMRNLISNAVKHHDRDTGEIRVSYRIEGENCIFLVADDGPGIPSSFLERVFEPFETLKSKDEGAGSGIGLSFVREAVQAWGGTVEALDTKGARGTCLRFSVPLADNISDGVDDKVSLRLLRRNAASG